MKGRHFGAFVAIALTLMLLVPLASASTTSGSGTDRKVILYNDDDVYANQTVSTALDNSSALSFEVTIQNNNASYHVYYHIYVNYTLNGVAKSSGLVNLSGGNSSKAWVNYTANECDANDTANVTIALAINGTQADVWYGTTILAYGTDYQLAYTNAMLLALMPVVISVAVIGMVFKILGKDLGKAKKK